LHVVHDDQGGRTAAIARHVSLTQIRPTCYFSRSTFLTAKRSIWDQRNIEDRPTTDLCFWKSLPGRTSNEHISVTVPNRRMVTMGHP